MDKAIALCLTVCVRHDVAGLPVQAFGHLVLRQLRVEAAALADDVQL